VQELYYIGEVSELLNISTQTLRYYDKIGIVQPAYVDPNTGYRKYTYDQVSYVDRIRYLQGLELNLQEISEAIQGNDVGRLTSMLKQKAEQTKEELAALRSRLEDLNWYVEYYGHIKNTGFPELPFRTTEPARYILAEPIPEGEAVYGYAGHRLIRRENSNAFRKLKLLRQVGYLLDYPSFLEGRLRPTHYFTYLKEKPPMESKYLLEIPAGDYFCLRTKLLQDPLPSETVRRYFSSVQTSPLMIANEYEDNFLDFKTCVYELQVAIPQMKDEP